MTDVAIHVEHLGKLYHIGRGQPRSDTLREAIAHGMSTPFAWLMRNGKSGNGKNDDTIWALQDVSFEVERGEILGIIGRNGAGKSTLLKILSRVTEPTRGHALISGRIGSLLEVGTGFHPELTGRENVYLNGAILGMKRAEIDHKFDEIVAFAEIEKFLDTPVKHYSSGMYVRLAFAVAAQLEPDILLVDEVLAVGDAEFQKKCLGRIGDVASEGRTVLFVSHNMSAISRLCERALWMDRGELVLAGETEEMIGKYLTSSSAFDGQYHWEDGFANPGVNELKIRGVRMRNDFGETASRLDVRKPFSVEIGYTIAARMPPCRIGFVISTIQGITAFEAYASDDERYANSQEPGDYTVCCEIPGNLLNVNRYVLTVNAGIHNVRNLAFAEGVLTFDVEDTGAVGYSMRDRRGGVVRPRLTWERRQG